MWIGTSLVTIVIGAILAYAINADIRGVDVHLIGLIVMAAGLIGLVMSIISEIAQRHRVVDRELVGPDGQYIERQRHHMA